MTSRRTADLPLVSAVFLAFNRKAELLTSLQRMLVESGYPRDRLEVVVVDNASSDGTDDEVRQQFPDVSVIRNTDNLGAPGWNSGFAVAAGDYVLILDDDAYLPPGDLERAVRAAESERAGLVSFSVVSAFDADHRLNDDWQTGLLSYWGCAALVRADAMRDLRGYDPNIFIWGNEAEFTMRLLDRGFRHLYMPEVCAVHVKERIVEFEPRRYLVNARHHGYIAGKLMTRADGASVVGNIVQHAAIDTIVENRMAITAIGEALAGYAEGNRYRSPVRPSVSAAYRRNFAPFAAPWQFMRSPRERLSSGGDRATAARQRQERYDRFFAPRAAFYPREQASLQL